jgi:hypothetical protein
MTQRIITKVGFVYKTKETSKGSRYLQLVAIDHANMNSDVVVVYQPKLENTEDIEKVVRQPIEFYMHATVSQGVREGLWEKVGKAPVYIDLSKLVFKYYRDQEYVDMRVKSAKQFNNSRLSPPFNCSYWNVWTLGDESYHSVNDENGKLIKGEEGSINPASSVVDRVEGRYKIPEKFWPLNQ